MLDRLLVHGVVGDVDFLSWAAAGEIETCERILIDNVSTYLYSQAGKAVWDWGEDFPNLAPPFADFWMEAPAPKVVTTPSGELVPVAATMMHMATGVMAAGIRKPEEMSAEEFVLRLASELGFVRAGVTISDGLFRAPIVWALGLSLFLEDRPSRFQFLGNRILWLDGQGRLVEVPGLTSASRVQGIWTRFGPAFLSPAWTSRYGSDASWEAGRLISSLLCPYGLALSLMHCKNVEILPGPPTPPKVMRAYQRRHKRPLLTYRVLEIEPMKHVLRTQGRLRETGLRQALHICRGHFKDYREQGLFGKARGIYWWESHVRGRPEFGAVVKDYNLLPATAAAGGAA